MQQNPQASAQAILERYNAHVIAQKALGAEPMDQFSFLFQELSGALAQAMEQAVPGKPAPVTP
eukprot:3072625-Alexandrium_andersonii.AAC.1